MVKPPWHQNHSRKAGTISCYLRITPTDAWTLKSAARDTENIGNIYRSDLNFLPTKSTVQTNSLTDLNVKKRSQNTTHRSWYVHKWGYMVLDIATAQRRATETKTNGRADKETERDTEIKIQTRRNRVRHPTIAKSDTLLKKRKAGKKNMTDKLQECKTKKKK